MPRNQAPLLAQVEEPRQLPKATDAALGIILDSELWRKSCSRSPLLAPTARKPVLRDNV
jgi:hypothetical protein